MPPAPSMLDSYFPLLVKLAAMASIASILARFNSFKSLLMGESRSLRERARLSYWLAAAFGASVAIRVSSSSKNYPAADLGLEGSLIAGILGGYVTGLCSGILRSLPAMLHGELLTMPLFAAVGVLGGVLRDLAPDPEEIWRFTPFPELNLYRFFKERFNHRRTVFALEFMIDILIAEFVRQRMATFPRYIFVLAPAGPNPPALLIVAIYAYALFAVAIPLKIWNNTRNEKKLEEQERLLVEARLAALTSQINPHFLFNTLNTIAVLVRDNERAGAVRIVEHLSELLRSTLNRQRTNEVTLGEELELVRQYVAIEQARFSDRLRPEFRIPDGLLSAAVPSFALQQLVENAIRHGIARRTDAGLLIIAAEREGDFLQLTVTDDGLGIDPQLTPPPGHGIENTRERLHALYGARASLEIMPRPEGGTIAILRVPYRELRPEPNSEAS